MAQGPVERLTKYKAVFGDHAGFVYRSLENEHFWLRLKWQEFTTLFKSRGRVEILDAAAPDFFGMLQDALSDDILMHIARLTDPAQSYNSKAKANLTVQVLPGLLPNAPAQLTNLVAAAVANAEFARDWRNRRLAHRDLAVALGTSARTLAPATRDSINRAVDSLHDIVAEVSAHYFNAHLASEVVEAPGGAEALLYVLRDGVRYRKQLMDRFLEEDNDHDGFDPLPP